ncbi:MAG: CoA-binding protein [Spirochaetes bacterium]|jgi:acyl-CoA synthetase (NDP forming)|nr:CoA-binding protein [Spirochaetota bacterium]
MNDRTVFSSIFEPSSIAFIGASADVFKWGFNILHHLVRGGFSGRIYPVNPSGGTWFGMEIYPSISSLPGPADLAVVIVPREAVPATVRECAGAGIRAAVVITAGFSETGPDGARLETEVLSIARAGGIRLIGPNTMGVYSAYPSPMQAVMMSSPITAGGAAVISQSGNLATSISYRLIRKNIGISRLVSSGNEADLRVEDFLEMLETDEKTSLVCLYMEGAREGRRFLEVSRRISMKKPMILMKGGTGAAGAGAAMSHTGAMAGSADVFRSMCRQTNVIYADSVDEMTDIAGILLSQPEIRGSRVGIVTQGGGWGVLSADLCESLGLDIPALNEKTISILDGMLPPFWSRRNPVDLVAPGRVSMITDTVEVLLGSGETDAIVLLGMGYLTARARGWLRSPVIPAESVRDRAMRMIEEEESLLDLIEKQIKRFGKPVIPVMDLIAFDERPEYNLVKKFEAKGIAVFPSPDPAIRALAKVMEYYRLRQLHAGNSGC